MQLQHCLKEFPTHIYTENQQSPKTPSDSRDKGLFTRNNCEKIASLIYELTRSVLFYADSALLKTPLQHSDKNNVGT